MKKIICSIGILLSLAVQAKAQKGTLTVGDTIPGAAWRDLQQYLPGERITENTKNSLLVLELWTSGCSSCLESMGKLAGFQKKFGKQVQPVLLTWDDSTRMKALLARRKDLAAFGLPWTPLTPEWKERFPNESFPHLVWIGADRQVKAITESAYLTENNIRFVLQNNFINLPVKRDLVGFNPRETFFLPKAGQKPLFSSVLTGPIEGVGSNSSSLYGLDSAAKRLYQVNTSLYTLYATAWRNKVLLEYFDYPDRIRLQLADSTLFRQDEYGKMPVFCYELIIPNRLVADPDLPYRIMQADLDRFFGLTSRVEKTKTKAWVLVVTDTASPPPGPKARSEQTTTGLDMVRYPAEAIPGVIKLTLQPPLPVIYEGPATKMVTGILKNHYPSMEALRKDLRPLGLDLVLKDVELDIIILSDK